MVGDVSLLAVQMRSLRPGERKQLPQPFGQGQEREVSLRVLHVRTSCLFWAITITLDTVVFHAVGCPRLHNEH